MGRRFLPGMVVLGLWALTLTGCLSWRSGWKVADPQAPVGVDLEALRREARDALARSDSPRGSEGLVRAWQRVVRASPGDREALVSLAAAWALRAQWGARSPGEQGEFYRNALQAAEKALALQPDFRQRVEAGAEVYEALDTLTLEEAPALAWWGFVVWQYYRDGLSGLVQRTQRRWLERVRAAGQRVVELDPSGVRGMGYLLQGLALADLPESRGGGLAAAAALFDRALEVAPGDARMLWTRAVLVALPRADRAAFHRDLSAILSAEASSPVGHPGWTAWYARQARDLLAREESLFR